MDVTKLLFVLACMDNPPIFQLRTCVCTVHTVYMYLMLHVFWKFSYLLSMFCCRLSHVYLSVFTDTASRPEAVPPSIPVGALFYPRPESKLLEDDLGDYIKMNPVSHLSSTLPAATRYEPPDFAKEIGQLCRSYDGLLGLGDETGVRFADSEDGSP